MMKSLYPQIEWDKIEYVGFDLDGTLYDEKEFIRQVYMEIAEYLSEELACEPSFIFDELFTKWTKMGSSYPYIFSETITSHDTSRKQVNRLVEDCLAIFRGFQPKLQLNDAVVRILEICKRQYHIFMLTDGRPILQQAKIRALKLSNWFEEGQIFITGSYGNEYYKPSIKIIEKMDMIRNVAREKIIYFGDRDVDKSFANQAGFTFIQVSCMQWGNEQ